MPCLVCGCPTKGKSRCAQHARTAERGYGTQHQRERRAWAIRIATQPVPCVRCHLIVTDEDDWHLDHTDDRDGYLGASHALCNTTKRGG